jgi:hypothetical protein
MFPKTSETTPFAVLAALLLETSTLPSNIKRRITAKTIANLLPATVFGIENTIHRPHSTLSDLPRPAHIRSTVTPNLPKLSNASHKTLMQMLPTGRREALMRKRIFAALLNVPQSMEMTETIIQPSKSSPRAESGSLAIAQRLVA